MTFSIRFKLASLFALFGILVTGLTGYYSYTASRDMLLNSAKRDLLTATQVLGRSFLVSLEGASQDMRVMANLPETRKLTEKSPTDSAIARAQDELADTFTSIIRVHPEYLQIRLIGLDNHGLERVRVERDGEQLVRVQGDELQEKAHFPYVFEAAPLPQGSVRLSPIVINHEKGAHSGLNKPTLTVSGPAATTGEKNTDLIVLNIDLNKLFTQLQSNLPQHYSLYLSNEEGDILIHPDASQTFGFDRGQRTLLQDSFPAVTNLLQGRRSDLVMNATAEHNDTQELVATFVRLPLTNDPNGRFVILGLSQPEAFIVQEARLLGWTIAKIVAILSVLTVLLSALASRALTSPLHSMMRAIRRFSKERIISPLPLLRSDELGQLARSFQDMQLEILQHLHELNDSRTALDHLAQHDPLTGLPNRRLFFERLEHAINNARRTGNPLAVLFVDLDYFKEINDGFGHNFGDEVLKTVARLLSSATREVDTVARLGGDEFVILFDVLEDAKDIRRIVQKLHERFQISLRIEGHEVKIRASMGVSLYPDDGATAEQLMQHADRAMYSSKRDGRNTYTFHDTGGSAIS